MHYKADKVRRALRHFVIGKAATAVSSIAVLVLLGKALPRADYAAYVSLQAVVIVVGALTSFGINQSLIRYAPELRASNNNLPLYRRLFTSLATRCAVIGLGLGAAWVSAPWWAEHLQLSIAPALLVLYLCVGWVRLMGLFLSLAMESLLWQKLSQYVLGGTSIVKLALAAWLAYTQRLDLAALFRLELATESLALLLLLLGLVRRWKADPHRNEGEPQWWRHHHKRVSGFARSAYLNGLTAVTYGSAPNRLIAARFLPPEVTAVFGFADALALLAKRFMPARLMQGMIRPVLIARYVSTGDFADLNRKVNLNFRLNSVLLCAPIALLITVGPNVLDWATHHKYGASAHLLAALLALLILDGFRAQLGLACEVVERPRVALIGNLTMGTNLFAAVALVLPLGVWGIFAAGLVGEVLAIFVTIYGLRADGFGFRGDVLMLSPLFACCIATLTGFALARWVYSGTLVVSIVTVFVYVAASLAWPAFSNDDKLMLRRLGNRPRSTKSDT